MKVRNVVMGFATAMVLSFATAPAHAKCNASTFTVACKEAAATNVDLIGGDGSECFAQSDGSGLAKACASDSGSFADSELSTGGTTRATAKGGSFSEATADHKGTSISHVSGAGGDGDATSDDKGTATTDVTGGAEGHTQAFGNCNATATSSGAGSFANAVCEHNGTHATAHATGGGHAEAFDDKSPICTPNGGTAKVRSSHGNCG